MKTELKKHLQKVLGDAGLHIAIKYSLNYLYIILSCNDGTLAFIKNQIINLNYQVNRCRVFSYKKAMKQPKTIENVMFIYIEDIVL